MLSVLLIPGLLLASFFAIGIWREAQRRAALARTIEALELEARAQPGGNPRDPIHLASPAQVETHARSMPCPLCRGALRVDEHAAETIGGERLRIAYMTCGQCGAQRPIYFRVARTGV